MTRGIERPCGHRGQWEEDQLDIGGDFLAGKEKGEVKEKSARWQQIGSHSFDSVDILEGLGMVALQVVYGLGKLLLHCSLQFPGENYQGNGVGGDGGRVVREEWLCASKLIGKICKSGVLGHREYEFKTLIPLSKLLLT